MAKPLHVFAQFGYRIRRQRLEDIFDLAGDQACLFVPKHSEIAGELVCDGLCLGSVRRVELTRKCHPNGVLQKVQTFASRWKMSLPQVFEKRVNLRIGMGALIHEVSP